MYCSTASDMCRCQDFLAGGKHGFLAQRRAGAGRLAGLGTGQAQDFRLGGGVRVVHVYMQQEAVQLRLGQGVGALLLNGVLGRHDQEQAGQFVGLAADADLALRHGFQQGRLHLGRGAVDLVRQHQVVENRALLEVEAGFLGAVDLRAGDIARQQVRGELDAVKAAFESVGQGFYGAGFGQPGRTLDQQVAIRQQGDNQSLYQVRLADDLFARASLPGPCMSAFATLLLCFG